jgi:hypothetical protein
LKAQWLVNNKESLNVLKENIDDDFIKAKIKQEKIEIFKQETHRIISDLKTRLSRYIFKIQLNRNLSRFYSNINEIF